MEYLDEIVLRERKNRKKQRMIEFTQKERKLPDEFFQTVILGEHLAEIKIPIWFQDMPETMINKRYLYEPLPQIVKTGKNGAVIFTFSILDVCVAKEELSENVSDARKALRRVCPTMICYEDGYEEINGIAVSWFAYMRNTLDNCKMYHMVFYAAMEKTAVITMECRYELREKWSAVAKMCIRSLRREM